MICFTDFVSEIETQMTIGFVACGFVTLHFMVNLALMLRVSLKGVVRKCKLRFAKKRLKKTRVEISKMLDKTREGRVAKLKQRHEAYM